MIVLFVLSGQIYAQGKTDKKVERLRPALLVIDIQNEYLPMIPEREKEVGLYMINAYIDFFRMNDMPIVRIHHTDPQWGPHPDSSGFQFPETIHVKPGDPKVVKNYGNAFNKTELDKLLKEKKCNTLFLCGLSSVGCVLATYFGARDLDYNAFMIKDAIMSHNSDYTDAVENIFGAVGYEVIKTMRDNAEK